MSLITKEVEVELAGTSVSHYEDLGYEIPRYYNKRRKTYKIKRGTKLRVKVMDLPLNSHKKIEVRCDNCNISRMVKWQDYNKCVHEDGSHYCKNCALKLYGGENIKKGKLKNSLTFEEWCIENNYEDILNRWNYELNECKPSDITYSPVGKFYFNCSRDLHIPELKHVGSFTSGRIGAMDCNKCNSLSQWGIDNIGEDFLEKYWSNKNILNPWETAKGSNKKVWIKCQEKNYHEAYEISCTHFTKGARCPFCSMQQVHIKDSLGVLLDKKSVLYIWSEENKKSPYQYAPKSNLSVWWKCEEGIHDDYKRNINNSNKFEFRCPKCVRERGESFLQEKVRLYLNDVGYQTLHEFDCSLQCVNPKTQHILPYDNEININNKKLIIEIHGGQHYSENNVFASKKAKEQGLSKKQVLEYQQWKDKYKKDYALSQGYFYLEIPYWTDNEDETWKKLVDNKIKKIKQKKGSSLD